MRMVEMRMIKTRHRKAYLKQARKPRSYASPKLCPASDSLTGVKCRATSVAKNCKQFKTARTSQFWTLPGQLIHNLVVQKPNTSAPFPNLYMWRLADQIVLWGIGKIVADRLVIFSDWFRQNLKCGYSQSYIHAIVATWSCPRLDVHLLIRNSSSTKHSANKRSQESMPSTNLKNLSAAPHQFACHVYKYICWMWRLGVFNGWHAFISSQHLLCLRGQRMNDHSSFFAINITFGFMWQGIPSSVFLAFQTYFCQHWLSVWGTGKI